MLISPSLPPSLPASCPPSPFSGASLPTEEEQANLFSWAGTFLHLKHDLDEARKVLEHSSSLNPDSPELLIKRGCLHLDRSELEEAKLLLEKARETSPTSAFVYLWRCQFWMSGKMTEEGTKEEGNKGGRD
ncbi:mitochondrial precursor protein import receptor [Nannochloropsis gaditana]|uniref:Mitochondrial protein import receptor n=1 Tax=Nannochloropsis gaditana TaxID=72520 RepID=W7T966_9STRA|nr:mitochondrial precursor protein import receptor [Nannochloropsis gaditana]